MIKRCDGMFNNIVQSVSSKSPTDNKQYNLPTEFQQRNKTTDEETEPNFVFCPVKTF